ARTGPRALCVAMLLGRAVWIASRHRVSPVDEICRGTTLYGAHAVVGVAGVAAVVLRPVIPEGEVERVKRALGHHRLGLQLFPMNPVGRDERVELALNAR